MTTAQPKYVSPTVKNTAFNCPHCGVLTTQYWHAGYANMLQGATPRFVTPLDVESERLNGGTTPKQIAELATEKNRLTQLATKRPVIWKDTFTVGAVVGNLWVSRCFNCAQLSIWIYDSLIWPGESEAPPANPDLPLDIRNDYEEAGAIMHRSPRGAAALLRLCVQKLCIFLKEDGKNINDDIASLVKKGLDVRVQQALDIVRVVGNDAVHPGQMDLRDDRETAEELFALVNLIAEFMISQPKHVEAMYNKLPESKRKAIEKRDGKTP